MGLEAGTKLGHYEIVALLGAGGMGEVYRARDPRIGRDVAVKVMRERAKDDADKQRRFEQEARAAGGLNHPGIVSVFDVGVHDEAPYVVIEFLEGQTLRTRLANGPLAPRKAIEIAIEIADALAAAHDHGIVHRDLKPENLFITKSGRIKILDFGIAKVTPPATAATLTAGGTGDGAVLGTAGYMAPEQVRGKDVDRRADVFALGVVLHEMLTGSAPFAKDTPIDRAFATLNDEPPSLEKIPPQLATIVRHCLEKDPAQRMESARDLRFALELVANGSEARVEPPRRRAWLLALAGVLVVGLGIGFVAARSTSRKTPAKPAPSIAFQRLVFRAGVITRARFAPDHKSVVFSAWFDGDESSKVYSLVPGNPEPRIVIDRDASLLDISKSGELALLNKDGVLSRAPLAGGAPRDVAEDVEDAAWAPSGELLVARATEAGSTLELPPGKVLFVNHATRAGRWQIATPAISPDGTQIVFDAVSRNSGPDSLELIGLDGNHRTLVPPGPWFFGLLWRDRREIWFSNAHQLRAVDLAGSQRVIAELPGTFSISDIAPDGSALLVRGDQQNRMFAHTRDTTADRDLSWQNSSQPTAISADGTTVLFLEDQLNANHVLETYVRKLDGSPAVRLASGAPLALSPDGHWAVVAPTLPGKSLSLVPTGPGQTRAIALGPITEIQSVDFIDAHRLVVEGAQRGHEMMQPWVVELDGATPPRALAPEGTKLSSAVSPTGKQVVVRLPTREVATVDVDTGAAKPLPGVQGLPVQWSADGTSLYLRQEPDPRTGDQLIAKYDLATAAQTTLIDIPTINERNNMWLVNFAITPDASTYVYSVRHGSSQLYLATGLR